MCSCLKFTIAFLAAVGLTAWGAVSTQAQNIVQDGGFEQARLGPHDALGNGGPKNLGDGWSANNGNVFVYNNSLTTQLTHSGAQCLGIFYKGGQVIQSLNTVVGQTYTLSFYAASADLTNYISVQFGGDYLPIPGPVPANGVGDPSDFTFYSVTVTAKSSKSDLIFTQYTERATVYFDDISVTNALPLASLTFPPTAAGGAVVTATVILNFVMPTDAIVGLSSTDSSVVRVHRAVVIPAGSTSATFPIITYPNPTTQAVTIQAVLGPVVLTKVLTVTGG